jgi:hypothetical protein
VSKSDEEYEEKLGETAAMASKILGSATLRFSATLTLKLEF